MQRQSLTDWLLGGLLRLAVLASALLALLLVFAAFAGIVIAFGDFKGSIIGIVFGLALLGALAN